MESDEGQQTESSEVGMEAQPFQDKAVIVTGPSSGIGKALVLRPAIRRAAQTRTDN